MFTRTDFPNTYKSYDMTPAQRGWLNQDIGNPPHRLLRLALWLLGYGPILRITPTLDTNPGWEISTRHPVVDK